MMQVELTTRVRGVCAAESSRYSMAGALISPNGADGGVWVSATDGRVAAVLKARADGELEGASIVPSEVLPNRVNGGRILHNPDGRWEDPKSGKIGEPIEGTFPPVGDILPDVTADKRYGVAIGLNCDLLHSLARAIGRQGSSDEAGAVVTLFIDSPKKAIAVYGAPDRIGVSIGPRRHDDERREEDDAHREHTPLPDVGRESETV